MGGHYILADVGSKDKLAPLQIYDKRVPQWLLPTVATQSRPDILMVHRPMHECIVTKPQSPPKGTKITIIEVTVTGDYDIDKNAAGRKQQQHQQLKTSLEAHGYVVEYQVWDIGHTGMIPRKLITYSSQLGIEDPHTLMTDLHKIAVDTALTIVQTRRLLERSSRPHATTATTNHNANPANRRPP
jgi:hypothetical protein